MRKKKQPARIQKQGRNVTPRPPGHISTAKQGRNTAPKQGIKVPSSGHPTVPQEGQSSERKSGAVETVSLAKPTKRKGRPPKKSLGGPSEESEDKSGVLDQTSDAMETVATTTPTKRKGRPPKKVAGGTVQESEDMPGVLDKSLPIASVKTGSKSRSVSRPGMRSRSCTTGATSVLSDDDVTEMSQGDVSVTAGGDVRGSDVTGSDVTGSDVREVGVKRKRGRQPKITEFIGGKVKTQVTTTSQADKVRGHDDITETTRNKTDMASHSVSGQAEAMSENVNQGHIEVSEEDRGIQVTVENTAGKSGKRKRGRQSNVKNVTEIEKDGSVDKNGQGSKPDEAGQHDSSVADKTLAMESTKSLVTEREGEKPLKKRRGRPSSSRNSLGGGVETNSSTLPKEDSEDNVMSLATEPSVVSKLPSSDGKQASKPKGRPSKSRNSLADLVITKSGVPALETGRENVVIQPDVSIVSEAGTGQGQAKKPRGRPPKRRNSMDSTNKQLSDGLPAGKVDSNGMVPKKVPGGKEVKKKKGRPQRNGTSLEKDKDRSDDVTLADVTVTSECDVSIRSEGGAEGTPVRKGRRQSVKRKLASEADKDTDQTEGVAMEKTSHVTSDPLATANEKAGGRRRSGRARTAQKKWSEDEEEEDEDEDYEDEDWSDEDKKPRRKAPTPRGGGQKTPRGGGQRTPRGGGQKSANQTYKKYDKVLKEAAADTKEATNQCVHCQDTFKSKGSLSTHMLVKHHRVYSVSHPEGEYAPRVVLKRLNQIHCLQCGKSFKFFHYFKYHCQWCGREDELAECEICQHQVKAMWLRQHVNEHKLKERRAQELEESKEQEEGEEGEQEAPEQSTTGRVKRKAASRAMDSLHKAMEEMDKVKSWITTLPQQIKYLVPGRVIPAQTLNKVKAKVKANGKATCPYTGCKKKSQYLNNLQFHMRTCSHGPDYPREFRCKLCNKTFPEEEEIISHCTEHGMDEVKDQDSDSEASDPKDPDAKIGDADWSDDDKGMSAASESEMDTPDEEEMNEDLCQGTKVYTNRQQATPRGRKKYRKTDYAAAPLDVYEVKMEQTLKWRKENEIKETLFPDWMPRQSNWVRLSQSTQHPYLPVQEASIPHVIVTTEVKDGLLDLKTPTDPEPSTLPRFTASATEDAGLFYVGGPVWSLAWCPAPHDLLGADQYMSVYCHREPDRLTRVSVPCRREPSLIQIWNCGPLTEGPCTPEPRLVLAIAVDCGAIWEMKWCPTGAHQAPEVKSGSDKVRSGSKVTAECDAVPRLGLLACCCEDGTLKIYSIPHPESLRSKPGKGLPIYRVQPSTILVLEVIDPVTSDPVTYDPVTSDPVTSDRVASRRPHCMCLDWSWKDPCSIVAVGFSDGKMGLWDLTTSSPLLRHQSEPGLQPNSQSEGLVQLLPYHSWQAHLKCVKSVALYHSPGDLLTSVSLDRQLYMWDLSDLASPIQSQPRSAGTSIYWPAQGIGPYIGYDDCFQIEHNAVNICDLVQLHGGMKPSIRHNDAIMSVAYSDWLHVLSSCDYGGAALGMTLTPEDRIHLDKSFQRRRFLIGVHCVENLHCEAPNSREDGNNTATTPGQKDTGNKQKGPVRQKDTTRTNGIADSSHGTTEGGMKSQCLVMHEGTLALPASLNAMHKALPCQDLTKMDTRGLHKICWSPNLSSHLWMVYAGSNGLVRLRKASGFLTHFAERTLTQLRKKAASNSTTS